MRDTESGTQRERETKKPHNGKRERDDDNIIRSVKRTTSTEWSGIRETTKDTSTLITRLVIYATTLIWNGDEKKTTHVNHLTCSATKHADVTWSFSHLKYLFKILMRSISRKPCLKSHYQTTCFSEVCTAPKHIFVLVTNCQVRLPVTSNNVLLSLCCVEMEMLIAHTCRQCQKEASVYSDLLLVVVALQVVNDEWEIETISATIMLLLSSTSTITANGVIE